MPAIPPVIRRALRFLVALFFLAAAFWTLRLGLADLAFRSRSPDAAARAARLNPENADYHARLAELDDAHRRQELEKAITLNPFHAEARIQLGLLEESEGDLALAERHLLDAARVNNSLLPRQTLADFYFRKGDAANFWHWARKASEMTTGDARHLYRLCWSFRADADYILATVIPDEPDHLVRYLLFLLEENRFEAGLPAALRLIALGGGARHRAILLGHCDRLIETKQPEAAAQVWNALIDHGVLRYRPVPTGGAGLTNGAFEREPLGHGFDWRIVAPEGVSVTHSAGTLEITLNGRQPDHCEVLVQYLPFAPEEDSRLRVDTDSTLPGLRWEVGREGPLGRVTLRYDRPVGVAAPRGAVRVRDVALDPNAP